MFFRGPLSASKFCQKDSLSKLGSEGALLSVSKKFCLYTIHLQQQVRFEERNADCLSINIMRKKHIDTLILNGSVKC